MKVDLSGLPPQANLGILSQVVAADFELAARHLSNASVAQLDRASVFGTEGWGFESLRVYSKTPCFPHSNGSDSTRRVDLEPSKYTPKGISRWFLSGAKACCPGSLNPKDWPRLGLVFHSSPTLVATGHCGNLALSVDCAWPTVSATGRDAHRESEGLESRHARLLTLSRAIEPANFLGANSWRTDSVDRPRLRWLMRIN